MNSTLTDRLVVAAVTLETTRIWAVNDPSNTHPTVVMSYPEDQAKNHFKEVSRNKHRETDKFDREYFEEVSAFLAEAKTILLIGHGKGKANAMLKLVQYLERYHPATAKKVIGALDTHLESLTDAEVVDMAKAWFKEPMHLR